MWEPRRLTNLWAFAACYRDSFTFFYLLPTHWVLLQNRHWVTSCFVNPNPVLRSTGWRWWIVALHDRTSLGPLSEFHIVGWFSRKWRQTVVDSFKVDPGYFSRYGDGLRAGRPQFQSRQVHENFVFSIVPRPALGPIWPLTQRVGWVPSPGGKAAGAWCWPLTST
jgi:hypothetical protein